MLHDENIGKITKKVKQQHKTGTKTHGAPPPSLVCLSAITHTSSIPIDPKNVVKLLIAYLQTQRGESFVPSSPSSS